MDGFQLTGLLLTAVAFLGYLNHRFVRLPDTVGITAVGMACSLIMLVVGQYADLAIIAKAKVFVASFDFSEIVFQGLLGLLLFAGALHVDISSLRDHKWPIFVLSTIGVLMSTALVGFGFYAALTLLGLDIPLLWCLAFGALISPTDPVVVMGVLRSVGLPKSLEHKIVGEALFNDGAAVVVFATLVGMASGSISDVSFTGVAWLLIHEVAGAAIIASILGFGALWLLNKIDSNTVEIFSTLALATAGYQLAGAVGASAPLAVVFMGLIFGSNGFNFCASDRAREHLFNFWSLLDELLNFTLFGLIGLQALTLTVDFTHLSLGAIAIVIVLVSRFLSVGIPLGFFRTPEVGRTLRVKVLTWAGLRGGISIALALSLPTFEHRELVQGVTYVVVAFSLLVQALTLKRMVARWRR